MRRLLYRDLPKNGPKSSKWIGTVVAFAKWGGLDRFPGSQGPMKWPYFGHAGRAQMKDASQCRGRFEICRTAKVIPRWTSGEM